MEDNHMDFMCIWDIKSVKVLKNGQVKFVEDSL